MVEMSTESDTEAMPSPKGELLPLVACWSKPLQDVAASLRRMVRTRPLEPSQLAAVAKLIYAVERLPRATEGMGIEASLAVCGEGGRGWLAICHYGTSVGLSQGETSYEPQGTEHRITTVLEAEVGCRNSRGDDDPITVLVELEDWVREWSARAVNADCEFEISDDQNEMDWNQAGPPNAWELVPDGV